MIIRTFIVDRNDPNNVEVLEKVPDTAPCMTLAEIFDLRGFGSPDLWKFAMLECVGKPQNKLHLSPSTLEVEQIPPICGDEF